MRRTLALATLIVASSAIASPAAAADEFWLSNPTSLSWTAEQTSIGAWPTTNLPSCTVPINCTSVIAPNQPLGSSNYSTNLWLQVDPGTALYTATLTPNGGSGSVTYSAVDPVWGPATLHCSGQGGAMCSYYALTGVLGTTASMSTPVQSAVLSNVVRIRHKRTALVPLEIYSRKDRTVSVRVILRSGGRELGATDAAIRANHAVQVAVPMTRTRDSSGVRVVLRHQNPNGAWVGSVHRLTMARETRELRTWFADRGPILGG